MRLQKTSVDRSSPLPLYYQVKKNILDCIKNGSLKPGDKLPREIDFEQMYGVSITTIRQAMKELVMEGYIYRVKSKGTYVSKPRIPQLALAKYGSFREEMAEKGLTPSIKIINQHVIPCSVQVAEKLRIPVGSDVFCLETIRYADNVPILMENIHIPSQWIDAENFDIVKEKFYTILSKDPHTKVHRSKRSIESRLSSDREKKYLKVPAGFPIQEVTIHDFNANGVPFLYGILSYRGDRNTFSVTLAADD